MSKMKVTGITMLFASLALAGIGIPFINKIVGFPVGTSGFVSKDAIILDATYVFAHMTHDWIPFAFGILAALLTAIYTFRLWFMAFTGKPRQERHPHESPATMTGVLSILAIFALVFGMLTFVPFLDFVNSTYDPEKINHLAELGGNPILEDPMHEIHHTVDHASPIIILLPVIAGVGGLLLAWVIYNRRWISVASIGNMRNPLFAILAKRYYQHEIFIELISLKFTYGVLALTSEFSDRKIVDGIIDGISSFIIGGAEVLKKIQTGVVQNYATATVLGVGLIALILSFREVF